MPASPSGPAEEDVLPLKGVLFVFLDGVGIGSGDPDRNPFMASELPVLRSLLGGGLPTLERPRREGTAPAGAGGTLRPAVGFPLDARLGVEGTPQSGTGQTALLTGLNGAETFGGHFGPWVPVKLRPVVEERSVLRRVQERGSAVAFANAYPRGWPGPRGSRRMAGPPLAARGAGVLHRDHTHLERREAVASEIENEGWRRHLGFRDLPRIAPHEAGAVLGRLAAVHALTLYAHYATDTAGHRGGMTGSRRALERVDAFLGGILTTLPDDHLLLVASDHGNIEEVEAGHTLNPALGLAVGPGAPSRVEGMRSILDVTPRILEWLPG